MNTIKRYYPFWGFLGIMLLTMVLFTAVSNKAIDAFSSHSVSGDHPVIVIDPGHGGIDGGATSCYGVLESGINLQIGLTLRDLMHLLGFSIVMTRTQDISIYTSGDTIAAQKVSDLRERVRITNTYTNGYLISLHQNKFTDGQYKGAQVFYSNNDISKTLAGQLQESLIATLNPGSNRTIKSGRGIYLLEHITQPGVLIECGFLSNEKEARDLTDPEYQKRLCMVIASVYSRYLFSLT